MSDEMPPLDEAGHQRLLRWEAAKSAGKQASDLSRRAAMYERRLNGERYKTIASDFGISVSRCRQIVEGVAYRLGREPKTSEPADETWMSIAEAAAMWGVSYVTAQRHMSNKAREDQWDSSWSAIRPHGVLLYLRKTLERIGPPPKRGARKRPKFTRDDIVALRDAATDPAKMDARALRDIADRIEALLSLKK